MASMATCPVFLFGFIQTFATALSGAIAAGALSLIGYVPGVEQSGETLFGLRVLIGILPAVFGALAICVVWFDLTEAKRRRLPESLRPDGTAIPQQAKVEP